jgi:hypothetical protein
MGVRNDIVTRIKTACESVSVAGGFYNDLAGKVYEWRGDKYSQKETIVVNIKDEDENNINAETGNGSQLITNRLDVRFEIVAGSGPAIRSVIADLKKVCAQNKEWSGAAYQTEYVSSHISEVVHAEDKYFMGYLIESVFYKTLEGES